MIFGLTSGWWLFSDTDLRPNHPLVSRETWLDVLKGLNFRETIGPSLVESRTVRKFLNRR